MPSKPLLGWIIWLAFLHPSQGAWLTYSQWERLTPELRAAYVAGAMDSYQAAVVDLGRPSASRTAQKYGICLSAAKMSAMQLADNVLEYTKSKPELHTGTVV